MKSCYFSGTLSLKVRLRSITERVRYSRHFKTNTNTDVKVSKVVGASNFSINQISEFINILQKSCNDNSNPRHFGIFLVVPDFETNLIEKVVRGVYIYVLGNCIKWYVACIEILIIDRVNALLN